MSSISAIRLNLANKLSEDPGYRQRFFRRQAQDLIAMSIRSLRKKRKMMQKELGEKAAMEQTAISRLEKSEYGGWSFKTLLRVADALDARLRIVLDPAEDVIEEYKKRELASEDSFTQYAILHETKSAGNDFAAVIHSPSKEETARLYLDIPHQVTSYTQGVRA